MYKFNVGDAVRIRTDIRKMKNSNILNPDGFMDKHFGKIATIVNTTYVQHYHAYYLKGLFSPWGGYWTWCENWLEKATKENINEYED